MVSSKMALRSTVSVSGVERVNYPRAATVNTGKSASRPRFTPENGLATGSAYVRNDGGNLSNNIANMLVSRFSQGRSVVFQFRYAPEGVVKQAPIEGASL